MEAGPKHAGHAGTEKIGKDVSIIGKYVDTYLIIDRKHVKPHYNY